MLTSKIQAVPVPAPQQVTQAVPIVQAEPAKPVTQVTSPQKDYAADLMDMLSLDDSNERVVEAASTEDNAWAGFQCMLKSIYFILYYLYFRSHSTLMISIKAAGGLSATGKTSSVNPNENKTPAASGIEDLFKDSSPVPSSSSKAQKDVNNDIMSLFEKV